MPDSIEAVEFTIFDTETTGLNPQAGDRIVELAALRVKGSQRIAVFDTLINPEKPVSPGAFAVNKITPQMLNGAPSPQAAIGRFLEFLQGSYLCSYNAEFDLGFLDNELRLIGRPALDNPVVFDVLIMARKLLPGLPRYALWFVAERLGIKLTQQHRALADVEMTWQVFEKLKLLCQEKGIADFANFSRLFAFNRKLLQSSSARKIAQIQECIDAKATLRIRYLSSQRAEVTEREVVPKEIRQERGCYYLIGYCNLKKDERTFRVDNILELDILR